MLAAPIILPDHPEVAPESPGELYDGTEIDEILTLRTLALSDDEKAAARATDPRAAALIDRVDAMDAPTMERLHGTIRAMSGPAAWLRVPRPTVLLTGPRVPAGRTFRGGIPARTHPCPRPPTPSWWQASGSHGAAA
jgi:hypothetical protein